MKTVIQHLFSHSRLTINEFCERTGIKPATLNDYLTGRRVGSNQLAAKIADALHYELLVQVRPKNCTPVPPNGFILSPKKQSANEVGDKQTA
jgi:transcriptional regulator with XRE-family HTH domain